MKTVLFAAGVILSFLAGQVVGQVKSEPLTFYQTNPPCANPEAAYLVMPGKLYTTEHHKVWVCGYRR